VLDNLISAHVVLANGTLVETSKTKNSDLFWAVRGAGHNFGILTSFEVNTFDIPSNWTLNQFIFAPDKLEAVFSLVNELEEPSSKRPAKLAMTGLFAKIPPVDPLNVSCSRMQLPCLD
jgi:FAD/FMN-containing dehydrogenase